MNRTAFLLALSFLFSACAAKSQLADVQPVAVVNSTADLGAIVQQADGTALEVTFVATGVELRR